MIIRIGDRIQVSNKLRNEVTSEESAKFYGPAGYYPEFGTVTKIVNDSGFDIAHVLFDNPIDRQTSKANIDVEHLTKCREVQEQAATTGSLINSVEET